MDIWLIEQGRYSDYHVVGVYDSEKKAREVADAINAGDTSDEARVSSRVLNPGVDELRAGLRLYLVTIQRDGTVEKCKLRDVSGYDLMSPPAQMWRRSTAPMYQGRDGFPDVMWVTCWARDENHAIKIANEHRTQFIALGEWDTVTA
jgi:hypothetical protein